MRFEHLWQCINPALDGFFARLELLGVPWAEDIDADVLDDAYLGTWSGGKPPSPIVRRLAESNGGPLTSEQMERLAAMLFAMNVEDWDRSWSAEGMTYDPISNYDMTEAMTNDVHTRSGSGSRTTTHGHTVTRTDALQTARTGTDTTVTDGTVKTDGDTTASAYGLNSSEAVPTDTGESSETVDTDATVTLTHNTTDAHTGTQTTANSGVDSEATTDGYTDTHSYTLTRTGNIGTMTTQDMLTQERVLRAWRLFYDRVFPDLDRILTLCTY